ncbi:MAG TPA: cobalamin-dependent protein [Thermoleophilia bacterium]|nr:cobalamin-dependent protein [Thermoleophilia bacterium]
MAEIDEVLTGLREAIAGYDAAAAARWAETGVRDGVDPVAAFEAMTAEIRRLGDKFEAGECWLPDLVGAASAVQAAAPLLEAEIRRRGGDKQAVATVVAGAVRGDIHSIGIEMVSTLLIAAGFEVHDLGIDVSTERFIAAIEENEADILAMSALLTVTAAEQRRVIEQLAEAGLRDRVKVMVGGGAISADFAARIGADGYEATAPGAVELAQRLVGA